MQRMHIIGVLALCLALAGCQGAQGDEAKGDVLVVQVGGDKVMLSDIQAEQPGATAQTADPGVIKRIVDRKLMAQAAAQAKLGDTAAVKAATARFNEGAAADAMVKKLTETVAAPSPQEIDQFIAAHPEAFAARKFLVIDQLELRRPDKTIPPPSAEGVKSLDEVQAKVEAAGLSYQRSVRVIDTASAAPAVIQRLSALPANAVFELGAGDIIAEGQILQVRSAPLTGALAREVAANFLKNQKISAAVTAKLAELRKTAGDKIKYSNGFSPPT